MFISNNHNNKITQKSIDSVTPKYKGGLLKRVVFESSKKSLRLIMSQGFFPCFLHYIPYFCWMMVFSARFQQAADESVRMNAGQGGLLGSAAAPATTVDTKEDGRIYRFSFMLVREPPKMVSFC